MMYIVDDDTKEEANNMGATSSSYFSSRLFIDIVPDLSYRGISCCLDNRYFGHTSHLLLHYKKKRKKYGLLCEDLFYKCYHIV